MKNFDKSKLVNKTNKELEVYINEPEKFASEAVECAVHILEDRGYRLSEIELESIARKQKANKKNKIVLGKEYLWASNLLFLVFLVSSYLLLHLVDYNLWTMMHVILLFPTLIPILICAILVRCFSGMKYLIPLLFILIAWGHYLIAFAEKLDTFENILMYSQYVILLIATLILFTYKKSPTS